VGAGAAAGAPQLGWSAPVSFDAGNAPTGISCPGESLCVAVDSSGNALTSFDPGAPAPHWSSAAIDAAGAPLQAVSCAAGGPCVAVDAHGRALTQAVAGASAWSASTIDAGVSITGVSCPTASLCVAVDAAGTVLSSTDPQSGHWVSAAVDSGHALRGVSCASVSLCVAVDAAGRELASTDPTGGTGAWHLQTIDFAGLQAVSCAASQCVAVDGSGDALASSNPGASGATWSLTPIDLERLPAVSCAETGLCAAVDAGGRALASDNAATAAPAWSSAGAGGGSLTGVSCLPGGLCVAVDSAGRSVSARPPAPAVATLTPTQATATSAVLAGSVDPRDAALLSCGFEYGTSAAYTSTVSCEGSPAAAGGAQAVTATIGGLEPNTTYHYRAIASSASGAAGGADATFTTGVSSLVSLVHPHPSITGTPAPGQTLTCHPGTAAGASATLSFAWLRELVPVAGSTGSTFPVKGRDSGHHLQCQVTATNGGGSATASSAFVTVPAGGVPASAGETLVGIASYRQGRVSLPVTCSPQAGSGCALTASLTAAGTSSRRRAVTLAATRVRLAAGAHRTIVLVLGRTGRRLLASRRRLSAQLTVSGTVIGVIQAQLAHELLVLNGNHPATATRLSAGHLPASYAAPQRARTASLAATPYMGWDTYFALGGRYSESTVLEEASRMVTLGLRQRGYRYVWLDVGWWHGAREADGRIKVSPAQWPHGLGWLTATLHAAGFAVGLYTDAGPSGCGGAGQGSSGHYQQDADTFAAWGFDAVKVDFCGGSEYRLEPRAAYAAFHAALAANSSRRPLLLSICNFLQPGQEATESPTVANSAFSSYSFGPSVGNSWRTDTDVGFPHEVFFADVLRNMDADAAAPQAAGPGHWNDPDYLAPDQGMNATQFRTQLSMWSMLAAPLMISDDLRSIRPESLQSLQNSEVLAIDQDPAGVQATLLSAAGNGEVWVKSLAGGSRAVALLNRGASATSIRTSAAAVGLPRANRYTLRDLWSHATSTTSGPIAARVPAFGTVLLRVAG
jgi:Alpha galactosidase A/Alpha galactosidase C-terminal beta sandwich domain